MPQVEVKCSVANCTYWGEGNNCFADKIMVDVDRHAGANFNAELGNELGSAHHDEAATSKETCCRTFKPKNK